MAVKPVLFALILAGCGNNVAGGTADGPTVFKEACARCHGDDGKPTESMTQTIHPRDLTAAEFRARVTPVLVENQIRNGSQNKLMPSFVGALSDAQIRAVAAYVASPAFLEK